MILENGCCHNMMYREDDLIQNDTAVWTSIQCEETRQQNVIELIPSENLVSKSVMAALGSVFTNKYSEGYPGKRYYAGNHNVDAIETLAIERAKLLFPDAEHVNVQPLSGSPANLVVFKTLMNLGDKFMGMSLDCGGHLTHGSHVSFSGQWYKPIPYFVDKETERIDYDALRKSAELNKPKVIISGSSAYSREIDFKEINKIAIDVGAYHFADISHIAGLIVGKLHMDAVKYSDVVTTTTHKTLRGPRGAIIMSKNLDKFISQLSDKKTLAELIDFNVFPGLQGGPHDNVTAAKAVAFNEALQPEFKDYAAQIVKNAKVLSQTLQEFGFRIVSGGTDNHLMLIDLHNKNISGKEAEDVLDSVGITVNKNTIPFDDKKPMNPSGIRIGTPLITTRGMKEGEMKDIAYYIDKTLRFKDDQHIKNKINNDIHSMCQDFNFYK